MEQRGSWGLLATSQLAGGRLGSPSAGPPAADSAQRPSPQLRVGWEPAHPPSCPSEAPPPAGAAPASEEERWLLAGPGSRGGESAQGQQKAQATMRRQGPLPCSSPRPPAPEILGYQSSNGGASSVQMCGWGN